jgi:hypothetical protein
MKFMFDRWIVVRGFRDSRSAKRAVRKEIESWWALQDDTGPVPDFTAFVEKTGQWIYCELEVNESMVTWFGSGCERGIARAVQRALSRLHPKRGSGAAVVATDPILGRKASMAI